MRIRRIIEHVVVLAFVATGPAWGCGEPEGELAESTPEPSAPVDEGEPDDPVDAPDPVEPIEDPVDSPDPVTEVTCPVVFPDPDDELVAEPGSPSLLALPVFDAEDVIVNGDYPLSLTFSVVSPLYYEGADGSDDYATVSYTQSLSEPTAVLGPQRAEDELHRLTTYYEQVYTMKTTPWTVMFADRLVVDGVVGFDEDSRIATLFVPLETDVALFQPVTIAMHANASGCQDALYESFEKLVSRMRLHDETGFYEVPSVARLIEEASGP